MISTGGPRNSSPGTINQVFFRACERRKPDALQVKRDGRYQPISHDTLKDRVRRTALGLDALGIRPGDRVAILSANRPEWVIADLGCLTNGVADVPIYPNLPPDQTAYVLRDSGAVAVFTSDADQTAKVVSVRLECPNLRYVITFDENVGGDMTLGALEAKGASLDTDAARTVYRTRADAVRPDDLATIIYTSGTTGDPKGVMLTHDNLYSNTIAACAAIPNSGDDTCLSFLPLSHSFERMGGYYVMLNFGASIAYAESMDTVAKNLVEVRPTLVLSVPRLYEKMYARVLENALSGGALKKRIFYWARTVGERWADVKLAGGTPRGFLALHYSIAHRLVFSKLQARTGGRLKYFVSGGAPLAPEIIKFFYAAGLVVLEGYGLTETSPVLAVNTPANYRIGTVGKPLPGTEIMIDDDGEILARGPQIMKGYYNKPAATAEAIDTAGWFHTGDIGELRDGFVAITDRKKDIIVTAGGKKIAPQPIENTLRTNKFVAQAVMIGDKRKYPVVLIVPNWEILEKWAKSEGVAWGRPAELIDSPPIREKMEHEVMGEVKGLAHFEMPKRIGLLENDFSVERGELTPTLKVKRRVIDKTYKSVIDSLYEGNPSEHEPALTA
jgi:long-chain acyl-CoA synthetase